VSIAENSAATLLENSSQLFTGTAGVPPAFYFSRAARRVEALKARNVIAQGNALGKVNTHDLFADPRWVGVLISQFIIEIGKGIQGRCTRLFY
jgi:hypothetical protein